jgi:hypothetical protein
MYVCVVHGVSGCTVYVVRCKVLVAVQCVHVSEVQGAFGFSGLCDGRCL